MNYDKCPDQKRLIQFDSGELPLDEIGRVENHVEKCDECQEKLRNLDENQDRLFSLVQKIPAKGDYQNEAELAIVMNKIEAFDVRDDLLKKERSGTTSHYFQLDDYQIVREISRGGMGVVYEARQLSLKRRVAIKFLPFSFLSGNRKKRFEIESQAVAILQHENIISVYSSGEINGNPYYVMPFIEGINLQQFMDSIHSGSGVSENDIGNLLAETPKLINGSTESISFEHVKSADQDEDFQLEKESQTNPEKFPFPMSTPGDSDYLKIIVGFGIQTAHALQHAHEMGIIHRDIKPSNLLINQEGHLWVTDFGLARIETDDAATQTGDVIGTIRYMSPEQAMGKKDLISNRTDVYSLGVTLYELATLSPFFVGENKQLVLHKVINEGPVLPRNLNSRIPQDLETIILKATNKKIENRYYSAREMADDLNRFLENRPILAKRSTMFDHFIKMCGRYKVATASIFTGFAILSVVSFAFMLIFSMQNKALEKASQEIELSKNKTLSALKQANEHNYAMSMRLASEALKEDDIIRAKELISNFEPKNNETDLRGIEWFILKNETEKFQEILKLSSRALYTICKNHHKGIIAVAGAESNIIILELNSLKTLNIIPTNQGEINGIDFTEDGEIIASAGDDGTVKMWSVSTGELRTSIKIFPDKAEEGKFLRVHRVKFTPDEKQIICTGNTEVARLVKISTPAEVKLFVGHSRDVTDIEISKDGKLLITGSQDETVRLWDIQSQKEIKSVDIPKRPSNWPQVTSLSFSKDQKKVAVGAKSHSIHIWDLEKDELLLIGSHKDPVQSVLFSSDEDFVIASDRSGAIKVWPVNNPVDIINYRSLNPKHSQLLHDGRVHQVVTGQKENELLSVGNDGCLRKSKTNKHIQNRTFKNKKNINSYQYTPESGLFCYLTTQEIIVYKENRDAFEQYWKIPLAGLNCINLIRNGEFLTAGGKNGQIYLWNVKDKKLMQIWKIDEIFSIGDLVITHDLRNLVVSNDSNISIYEIEVLRNNNFTPRLNLVHEMRGKNLSLFPQQNKFTFCFENTVSVWDCEKQNLVNQYDNLSSGVDTYYITNDEKTLIISDKRRTLHFWDYMNDRLTNKIWKHSSSITGITESPDNQTLITSDRDFNITFWHIKTAQPIHSMKYRLCEPITLLNSGKLLSRGNVYLATLDILDFGRFWNEHYKSNCFSSTK